MLRQRLLAVFADSMVALAEQAKGAPWVYLPDMVA